MYKKKLTMTQNPYKPKLLLINILSFLFVILFKISSVSFAQQSDRSGVVVGYLLDGSYKYFGGNAPANPEPLYSATVTIKGTSIGAVTDLDGFFRITNVPAGEQVLVMRYVGYEAKEVEITVNPGETTDVGEHELDFTSVMGETVVVTAQMRGQASAINQQVRSNKIVNIVSSEKISEIPDVNAAESLSRLPGITLNRSGGEGSTVSVRGVAPRFNSVTVNGQTLPSSSASSRSLDLSIISSDNLGGIELYKAITPDMDADAVGGSVNLVTKTAEEGFHGTVHAETGYHSLINNMGTYRGSVSFSNRFLDDKLGLIVGGNYHTSNRNTDFFDGDYELKGDGGYRGNNARFRNQLETRDRGGFSATADYKFNNGEIVIDQFYSATRRDIVERGMRARPTISVIDITFSKRDNELDLNSTNLRGRFDLLSFMELSFNLGRSKTTNSTPVSYGTIAERESGLSPEADDAQPLDMFRYARFDLEQFYGGAGLGYSNNNMEDENYNAQADFKLSYNLGNTVSGYFKTGGKIRQNKRIRTVNSYSVRDGQLYDFIFRERFPDYRREGTLFYTSNVIDRDYEGYEAPFEPHNQIPFIFDPQIIKSHYETMTAIDSLWAKNVSDYFNGYDAFERITAFYAMTEMKLGEKITFIPGFRYENTFLDYTGTFGTTRNNEPYRINRTDTTATNSSGEFLPMIHLKYEFIEGFSLRLAATKTLSRPNFLNLTPFTHRHYANTKRVNFGSIDLKIPTAWNYDAMLTWFSRFGLFSVGAFYKEIYDIDINVRFFDYSGDVETNPYYGWLVNNPINSKETTTIYGLETEVQTNFHFLPKPFDGIVLSGNFSLMNSETYYPFFYTDYPAPDYLPVTADSARINTTQGQADFIANFTLGYEKGNFSGRVSMNYQGYKLASSGPTEFQDEFNDEYMRWDATLSYKFSQNWQLLVNLINFTNETERNFYYIQSQPSRIENYGWQANLAVRYRF